MLRCAPGFVQEQVSQGSFEEREEVVGGWGARGVRAGRRRRGGGRGQQLAQRWRVQVRQQLHGVYARLREELEGGEAR